MNSRFVRLILFVLLGLMSALSSALSPHPNPPIEMVIRTEFLFPKNSPILSPGNQEIALLLCQIGQINSLDKVIIGARFSELAEKKSQELLQQRVDYMLARLVVWGIPKKVIKIGPLDPSRQVENNRDIVLAAIGTGRKASVKCTPYLSTLYALLSVEQSLLVVRADLKEERYSPFFPLMLAIREERSALFDALLTQSTLVNFSAKARQELMNVAIDNNQPDVIESLIAHGMALKDLEHPALPIVRAVCDESPYKKTQTELIRVVEKLLAWGASVETIRLGDLIYGPISCARQRNQHQVVELLQLKGSPLNSLQASLFTRESKYPYIKTRDKAKDEAKNEAKRQEAIQACADSGGTWDETFHRPEGYCVADTEEKCTARSGVWRRGCVSQSLACIMPYTDAGKDCTDSSQCQGRRCLAVKGKESPDENGVLHGVCRKITDPCGASPEVSNGKRGALRDVD